MSATFFPFEALESALWSHKPKQPPLHWPDLVQQQLDTVAGNLGVLPQSEQLGSQVNSFLRGERAKTLGTIPGLGNLEDLTLQNLTNWSQGRLGPDTAAEIRRNSNARAFAGGFGGSGFGDNLTARDLGLGSLQLQQSAFPMAQQYIGNEARLRGIPEYNPVADFLNPMQSAEYNARKAQAEYQRNWLQAISDAQPEPWQQAIMQGTQQLGAIGDTALGSFAGSALGSVGLGGGGTGRGGLSGAAPPPGPYGNQYWAGAPYPGVSYPAMSQWPF